MTAQAERSNDFDEEFGDERDKPRRSPLFVFLRDVLVIIVIAIVVSALLKAFLIRSFFIPSQSMQPTLQVDDRVIVNQLVPDPVDVQRGDVVVFRDPGGWLMPYFAPPKAPLQAGWDWFLDAVGVVPADTRDNVIKRVIGLPGDNVACCDTNGRVSINGVAISEPYITVPEGQPASGIEFDVTVPENMLWVMGDNRYNSEDSRFHANSPFGGFVPFENVVGKAFVISWPIGNWGGLDNYPQVFAPVPNPGPAPTWQPQNRRRPRSPRSTQSLRNIGASPAPREIGAPTGVSRSCSSDG